MFDAHCHLHDRRVSEPLAELARARQGASVGLLLAGVDPVGWQDEIALCGQAPDIWLSFGVHPQVVAQVSASQITGLLDTLEQQLQTRHSALVSLGEIGLDALPENKPSLALQTEVFETQLRLAQRYDLPVSLHILRAHEEALKVLKRTGIPRAGGLVHSYSGSPELVPRYLELGLHLSFSGAITWQRASRAARSAQTCPAERLLVETDAPDQTPESYRPGPNQLAFLPAIIERLAEIRGETPAQIAKLTEGNARKLFRISQESS